MENAFGCQSACAQMALPPGPAFGAASAYEKCILDGGPQCIYMYIYIHMYGHILYIPILGDGHPSIIYIAIEFGFPWRNG